LKEPRKEQQDGLQILFLKDKRVFYKMDRYKSGISI